MRKFKVKQRYSGVLVHEGRNHPVNFADGVEVELEDWMADLINHDSAGTLVEVKAERKAAPVETKPGPTEKAKTRQVAKKPAAKRPAKKGK